MMFVSSGTGRKLHILHLYSILGKSELYPETWKNIDVQIFFAVICYCRFCRAKNFFLETGQYGYQKTQYFTLIPNPKAKLKKNACQKSYSQKLLFCQFFKITFYWCTFSQFHLQIWNKHKILSFLIPVLNNLREKNLGCILKKIISVKIGQNGYQNTQNFILIPNLKT